MSGAFARIVIALALVLAACKFELPTGESPPDSSGGSATDGPQSRRCTSLGNVAASDLRLCLELEDASPMAVARDGSGLGHDARANLIGATVRGGEQAGTFVAGSHLTIDPTPDLDISPHVTIDLFAAVQLPIASGARYWMLDHGDHYFVSYGDNHEVRCGINHDQQVDSGSSGRIEDALFHHIACTYDNNELRVYIDGDVADCQTPGVTIDAAPKLTEIGHQSESPASSEQFLGALDNIHVFARVLAPAEICALAGRGSGCRPDCPGQRNE